MDKLSLTIFTIFALLLFGTCGANCASHSVRETLDVRVTDKENVVSGDQSTYLIFTDREVFANEDSLLEGKYNSSDVYSALEEDKCYTLTVYGWRVPFLSMYRNIASHTSKDCENP